MGMAPNDFLLLTRDMETQEIYALNLKGLLSGLRHTYILSGRIITFEIWWTRWDSNPRPPHCEQWGK